MLSRYDENELLAIIEGELDDAPLADDPQARALIAAMRRDREILRSEPEPQLPNDLAAKIEQALTRPMLIAAWGDDDPASDNAAPHAKPRATSTMRPGEFRRHHHRPARVRRIVRFVLAASVAVVFAGALWMGIDTALSMRADHQRMIAQQQANRAADDARAQARPDEPWPPAGSAVHHYAPEPVLEQYLAGRIPANPPPLREPSMAEPIAVEFALVVASKERTEVEVALKDVVAAHGSAATLVQHMSRAEARRIFDQFHASRDPSSPASPLHMPPQPTSAPARPLSGSAALAPSFGQQLDYAIRGATHTITIRLSQLTDLLEDIEQAALPAALQQLPGIGEADRRSLGAARWIESRAAVLDAIAKLEETGEDPLIHLPVVME